MSDPVEPTPEPTTGVLTPARPEADEVLGAESPLDAAPTTFYDELSDGYLMPKRRTVLPLVLFVLTCFSTFWVGAITLWNPDCFSPIIGAFQNGSLMGFRQKILANWDSGLIYMSSVMLILILHEMGHFLLTLYYRVPASFQLD